MQRWRELPLRSIAASLLLLIAGTWAGWHLRDAAVWMMPSETHVPQEAIIAYAVYTPEVHHPVEVTAEQEQHLVDWLSKRLNAQVRVPHLDSFGFRLMGGRLLATSDGPGALFMYENDEGRRMVLYLCENDLDGSSTAFRFSHNEGVSVSYWFDGPFSYAVVGELDRPSLQGIAQVVYQAFQA
jgi:anti-sigma factor RsiW